MKGIPFALLVLLASTARAQFPTVPRPRVPVRVAEHLPSVVPAQEAPITTSLDDILPDAPFLDDFAPAQVTPMTDLPHGLNGSFYLYPGTYWFEAKSYCLRAGTYGPSRGDAYFYAPLEGPKRAIVRSILQRSVQHAEIPQHDVQVLLWAIIARAKPQDMSPDRQRTAAALLTPAELLDLDGYGLGPLSDALRAQALAHLPEPARRVVEAENHLREMVASTDTRFEDLERVAVLAGMAPPDPEGHQAPPGRWSYHPGGYFIRYQPHGYSSTRIELYVPDESPVVERDSHGRIVSVQDPRTRRIGPPRRASGPPQWYDASDGPAVPGNRGAQRLGVSGAKQPGRHLGAEEAIDNLKKGKDAFDFATDPHGFFLSKWAFAIPDFLFDKIQEFTIDMWGKSAGALDQDPPRSDYTTYAKIDTLAFVPLTPGRDLPPARAAAANRLMRASLDLSATLRAAQVSLDRVGGANQAGDTVWGWRQGAAFMYYKRAAGTAMLTAAHELEAMLTELRAEGVPDVVVTPEEVRASQARLRTQGFSAEELQAAHALRLTDEEIEANRQTRIAADPVTAAGSVRQAAAALVAGLTELGALLAALPPVVPPWTEGGR